MSVKEIISSVIDEWFIYEPLLFNVYCTHKLEANSKMKCRFRTGKRRIEYNPELLKDKSALDIEQGLKNEVMRILLKHPYQRLPQNINQCALTTASDVTLNEHCFHNKMIKDAAYYNLKPGLSYEEYYKKLYYICPDFEAMENDGKNQLMPVLKENEIWDYEAASDASELWGQDYEMIDFVNHQIQKAMKGNQWGSISGSFRETITASLKIPVDYRRILSQFRASINNQNRKLSRMKPNRRYGFEYMGSVFKPETRLLVAVDVSSSIDSEDLKNFLSIINRFFSYGIQKIHVLAFDTEIKQELEFKGLARSIKIIGRGGTDFQCAIDYYESHPQYQGLIIFTDGNADVPKLRLHKQILWIMTGKREYDYAINWIRNLRSNKATWIP